MNSVITKPSSGNALYVQSAMGTVTVSANSTASVKISASVTGMTPVGIVGVSNDQSGLFIYYTTYDQLTNEAMISFRNVGGSQVTATVTVYVLFKR